jgi:sortase (surface protein transpeptidase)
MRTRPVHSAWRPGRRLWVLPMVLAGAGLIALSLAFAVERPGARELDAKAQDVRDLPLPVAYPLAKELGLKAQKTPVTKSSRSKPRLPLEMPRPIRVIIPAIGVSAPVIPLGLNTDGTLQVPETFSEAGWFKPGPEPGEVGSAVVVGHVDSRSGPGVFYRLPALRRGDHIKIVLADRRALRFVVTSSRQVLKQHFPVHLVYRRTHRRTLRLVTCGGQFDPATGHYLSNTVVFAWLVGWA